MVKPGFHSWLLAAVKVTRDVCDLWESKWWEQHWSSWFQTLGNWILQELRRWTPPCVCLRNANSPNQLVKCETDAAGVRVWSALLLGIMVSISFQAPWDPRWTRFPSREVCVCLRIAGCQPLYPSEDTWGWGGVWESKAFSFAITVKIQGVCRSTAPGDMGKKPFETCLYLDIICFLALLTLKYFF